jgi:hypothetical protein
VVVREVGLTHRLVPEQLRSAHRQRLEIHWCVKHPAQHAIGVLVDGRAPEHGSGRHGYIRGHGDRSLGPLVGGEQDRTVAGDG